MVIVGVSTGIEFGPWRMPTRAQNIIMNSYAASNKFKISDLIDKGIFYSYFPRTRSLVGRKQVDALIFSSAYQMPLEEDAIKAISSALSKITLHFALENISGKGSDFLLSLVNQVKLFQNNLIYDQKKLVYSQYQGMLL